MRITATHLTQWSDKRDTQGMLPILVRRLISATSQTTGLIMPGGDSVNVPGWDGVIEAIDGNAWVPIGKSYWELGTSKDPGSKATNDFEKRLQQISREEASKSTFVFVTPRRWPGKSSWLEKANNRNVWADVKAWDADDLEAWLENAPAITLWMGSYIGIAGYGIESTETYWQHWSQQSSPAITDAALFNGREESISAVKELIKQKRNLITVIADSQAEAVAFVCAFLIKEGYSHSAVCITSEEGWQFVDANPGIEFALISDNKLSATRTPRPGISLIIPMALGDQTISLKEENEQETFILRRQHPEDFERSLLGIGVEASDATRYTSTLGRSWTVFRRTHAQNPFIKKPTWVESANTPSLLLLTLAGAWNGDSEGDKACIAQIANISYEEIENELLNLVSLDDSPVVKIGSTWKAKAPLELLHLIAPKLTSTILKRFFEVASAVFEEHDPALELKENQRWMATIHGKIREQSDIMLKAMADSIAKLGYFSDNFSNAQIGSHVRSFVTLLLEDASEERWLSIASYLTSFAEAAPNEFLNALQNSLQKPDKPVARLITETQHSGTMGRCWHANLLWALELLAWYPARLGKVSIILAQLSEIEIKGNWGNTPFNSLTSLFRLWCPQTTAPVALKLRSIRDITQKTPSVAWDLLLTLLPDWYGFSIANARPKWRDDDAGISNAAADAEISQLVFSIANLLLEEAQGEAKRIADLIPKIDKIDDNFRNKVISLITDATSFADEGREIVRSAVREFLNLQNSLDEEEGNHDRYLTDTLRPLFDELAPSNLVIKHSWLLSDRWAKLPDGKDEDYEKSGKARASLRTEAIQEIYSKLGWKGIEDSAKRSADAELLGRDLIHKSFDKDDLISWLCQWYLNLEGKSAFDDLTRGVLNSIPPNENLEFIKACLKEISAQTNSSFKIAGFICNAPQNIALWKITEVLPTAVHDYFWKNVRPSYIDDNLSFCVEKLLTFSRPKTAMNAMGSRIAELSSDTLIRILKDIAIGKESDLALPRSWHISTILEALSKKNADHSEIVSLEFTYYSVLKHGKYGTPYLKEELLSNPELFFDLIRQAFKPRHSKREPLSENSQATAELAGMVLFDGRGVPGKNPNGEIDRERFFLWVNKVRTLAKDKDREVVTDLTIGSWLSDWPIGKSLQNWPVPIIAELLEQDDAEDIRRGFHSGVYNSRGVTSRGAYDGGIQERQVADEFRRFSSHWSDSKPNLFELLENLAKSYERDAQHHDEDGLWAQEY